MAANATEINETYLTNAANAIRTKKGTTGTIKAVEFPSQISSISTGSSASGTINITTNGTHNVSSYATANVNVPSGGESKLEWTINNTISHTIYDCIPRNNYSSSIDIFEEINIKMYKFYNQLEIYLYPAWGYRFKNNESNVDNIQITEVNGQRISSYNSNGITNVQISNNYYAGGWVFNDRFRIYLTSSLYTSSHSVINEFDGPSETINISGTVETESIPALTTFNTSGLTKTWTGTLTLSDGTLLTDNTFPYWYAGSSTMLTTSLNLKFMDLYNNGSRTNMDLYDDLLVNKLACPLTTGTLLLFGNGMYMTDSSHSNECYIQIGNIFIHFIPGGNEYSCLFIPENCAIETLIEYLQSNLVNDGDSIPIYKWVASS